MAGGCLGSVPSLSLGEFFIPFTASFVFFPNKQNLPGDFFFYMHPLRLEHNMRAWCDLMRSTAPTWWFSGAAHVWPPASATGEVEQEGWTEGWRLETETFQGLFPSINVFFCPWVEMKLNLLGGVVVPHCHLKLSPAQRWIGVLVLSLLPKNIYSQCLYCEIIHQYLTDMV